MAITTVPHTSIRLWILRAVVTVGLVAVATACSDDVADTQEDVGVVDTGESEGDTAQGEPEASCSPECEPHLTCCELLGDTHCVDTDKQRAACGGCGIACQGFEECIDGQCQCDDGYENCTGEPGNCERIGTSLHCSECNDVCEGPTVCRDGECVEV